MQKRGYKLLVALAVPMALIAGSGAAQAEIITFANNAGQEGGTFSIGGTVQISDGRISAVALQGGASDGRHGHLRHLRVPPAGHGPLSRAGYQHRCQRLHLLGCRQRDLDCRRRDRNGSVGHPLSGHVRSHQQHPADVRRQLRHRQLLRQPRRHLGRRRAERGARDLLRRAGSPEWRQRHEPVLLLRRSADWDDHDQPVRRRRGEHEQPAERPRPFPSRARCSCWAPVFSVWRRPLVACAAERGTPESQGLHKPGVKGRRGFFRSGYRSGWATVTPLLSAQPAELR